MARYDDDYNRNEGGRRRHEQGEHGDRYGQHSRWRERPGEEEGRWAEEYGRGESEFDYRRGHSRQQPWEGDRDYGQGDYGGRNDGAPRSGGNYVTGIGRQGYDAQRGLYGESEAQGAGDNYRDPGRRYGRTSANRFNEQGWYGGPDRFAQGNRSSSGGYGGQYGSQYDPTGGRSGHGQSGQSQHHDDPDYMSWRERQLGEYDRQYRDWRDAQARSYDEDYGSWRKERQEKFGKDFSSWRESQSAKSGAAKSSVGSSTGAGTSSVSGTSSNGKSGSHST